MTDRIEQKETVIFEKRGHVAILTLNRPERLNAVGVRMAEERKQAIEDFDRDDDAWVLIVTGAGRSFSVGADLKDAAERADTGRPGRLPESIRTGWKPVIAAVNGLAYGGGFEMALECELRICSTAARFAFTQVKRGVMPGRATWFLRRLIPAGQALHYLLTGDEIPAQEALRLGLVSMVCEPEDLLPEAIAIAGRICANGPLAVRAICQTWRETADLPGAEAERYTRSLADMLIASEDAAEAARAFREKRPPIWKGR